MKSLVVIMQKRLEAMKASEQKAKEQLEGAPDGRLRIYEKRGHLHFYHITDAEDKNGIYMKNDQQNLARELAQKDYLIKLLKSIRAEIKALERFMRNYPQPSPETVYSNLSSARKALVTPLLGDDEAYAEWWQAQPYAENSSFPEEKKYATKRGELVRSKSEAMIADAYFDLGIPYKYDYPVEIGKGKYRYVDFVLLDVRSGRLIYHEHLGRMDDPLYLHKNMIKLDEYRKIGIFSGKNLLLTTETEDHPLNMNLFRKNTAELFGKALP
ncbi:MAG: hypothetical protein K6A81_11210 [Clostridiales bacterium]|nr:hypothetical protein [Clostridiales bacterium]